MRGRAGGRRDGARFAREGRPNRGRRHSADERAPAEAPRQPGPRLHLKGLRRRPWGDRRRPGVAERALAHTTRTRSDDRRVRPRRERLAAPSRHRSRGFIPAASRPGYGVGSVAGKLASATTASLLLAGRTEMLEMPVCKGNASWTRWRCTVRAQATIGPFAGRTMRYYCDSRHVCGPDRTRQT